VCDSNICIQVFGTGNDVSKVDMWVTHHTYRGDTFYLFVESASPPQGHGRHGFWKSWVAPKFSGTKEHTWLPACSWPGSYFNETNVYGEAKTTVGLPRVGVYGGNYTGKHPCGFL
jgi:hypothetical protein